MNEKIKEIAEFDGLKMRISANAKYGPYWTKYDSDGLIIAEYSHECLPYLTDLNTLHKVALDVMDKLKKLFDDSEERETYESIRDLLLLIEDALLSRPINGEYTDLVDAVYEAIVYLKNHNQCQPK